MQNESERKRLVCPIFKEICKDGHCKSMGEDTDGCQNLCRWWVHVVGKDPQSNKDIDWFDCAISWLPTLAIEQSQTTRQLTASVDKTANTFFGALDEKTQQKIILQGNNEHELLTENS